MKVFTKKLKPWFKPYKKKATTVDKPASLKLHTMSHKRLIEYTERIGMGVCSMADSYATTLAMHMMDALYQYNDAYTQWRMNAKVDRHYELERKLKENRNRVCECLNRIAHHYMQTEKDYIKAMTEVGFEINSNAKETKNGVQIKKQELSKIQHTVK